MSETERLRAWMDENGYSVIKLAVEVGMTTAGLNMIFWRKSVSPGFKLRFIKRFGMEAADQIFSQEAELCPA